MQQNEFLRSPERQIMVDNDNLTDHHALFFCNDGKRIIVHLDFIMTFFEHLMKLEGYNGKRSVKTLVKAAKEAVQNVLEPGKEYGFDANIDGLKFEFYINMDGDDYNVTYFFGQIQVGDTKDYIQTKTLAP